MDSPLASVGLPIALAVIMFGLGLSLTVADFTRVARAPRILVIALGCQVLLLPLIAFGLAVALDLPPILAVGLLLLAASPGGTTANLFSHLFGGDVALNISLTAVNSVIAVVTLPVVTNAALRYFDPGELGSVGLQFGKALQVFAVVLVPVALGMLVRRLRAGFAERMDRPVRVASAVLLGLVVAATLLAERGSIGDYLADVGLVTTLFCLLALGIGFAVPRLLGVGSRQAIATSMEVGIHNSTLAITIAVGLLDSTEMAVPAAVYGVLMFPLAAIFGTLAFPRDARRESLRPQPDSHG